MLSAALQIYNARSSHNVAHINTHAVKRPKRGRSTAPDPSNDMRRIC